MDSKSQRLDGLADNLNIIPNTGGKEEGSINYKNQCMFISILDYINNFLGHNLTLTELRHIGGLDGIL